MFIIHMTTRGESLLFTAQAFLHKALFVLGNWIFIFALHPIQTHLPNGDWFMWIVSITVSCLCNEKRRAALSIEIKPGIILTSAGCSTMTVQLFNNNNPPVAKHNWGQLNMKWNILAGTGSLLGKLYSRTTRISQVEVKFPFIQFNFIQIQICALCTRKWSTIHSYE